MWIYTIQLNEKKTAGEIEGDWEADHPSTTSTGTSVAGFDAVITSTPRAPSFEDFADQPYVDSITEEMELPDPGSANWDPPYSPHPNGTIEFIE